MIASMEGVHATSDAPYVLARLGPARAEEGAYVWQANFHATITRKTKDGSVFYGDQEMSRAEALRPAGASRRAGASAPA